MADLKAEAIILIGQSNFIPEEAQKNEWIDKIVPQMTEKDLAKFIAMLEEGVAIEAKELEILKEKYTKAQTLLRQVQTYSRVKKEEKDHSKELDSLEELEAELDDI
ncbi:hypothetical protein KAI58_00075 [Candidatus Gracilibacteria bacterium]|nr:hypothetical protein [Candidatus Gracilibacteria bacterium]